MNKKMTALLLCAAMTTALPLSAAAEPQTETGDATLNLVGQGLTLITDRDEIENELPDGYEKIGGLSIDFGTRDLDGEGGIYKPENEEEKAGLIVRDARGLGSASQWYVNVSLSEFSNGTTTPTLVGSELHFVPEIDSLLPNEGRKPTLSNVDLSANRTAQIFSSNAAGSPGLWGANWSPSLEVPTSAESGSHKATLTWTLGSDIVIDE